jgi:hypothetical protein
MKTLEHLWRSRPTTAALAGAVIARTIGAIA